MFGLNKKSLIAQQEQWICNDCGQLFSVSTGQGCCRSIEINKFIPLTTPVKKIHACPKCKSTDTEPSLKIERQNSAH